MPNLVQGHYFNLPQMSVGAALAGQGVAMGRTSLVLDELSNWRLVMSFDQRVRLRASYFFVTRMLHTMLIHKWIAAEAEHLE